MTLQNIQKVINAYKQEREQDPIIDIQVNSNENVIYSGDEQAQNTIKSILKHKKSVYNRLLFLANELKKRAEVHDDSKLRSPEVGYLIDMDKEGKVDYGSEAYFEKMKKWDCFFKHHYKENTHHPDHHQLGIDDMTIIDLCEYMIDVVSYFEDLQISDAIDTIDAQQERFGLSDQTANVLKNTLVAYYSNMGGYESAYAEFLKKQQS